LVTEPRSVVTTKARKESIERFRIVLAYPKGCF
jgi:hypothetical protein